MSSSALATSACGSARIAASASTASRRAASADLRSSAARCSASCSAHSTVFQGKEVRARISK
eukprot:361689-Chlamydomonas_euryale.AAC.13